MSTFLTDEGHGFIRRLRFSPEVEADFQENYYRRVRPTLRMGLCAIIAPALILGLAQLRSATPGANPTAVLSACLAVAFFNLLLLGATFLPKFTRHWQFIMATSVFVSLGLPLAVDYKATLPLTVTYTVLIWFRIYRLQLRWITLQYAVFMSLNTIQT